jgi:hypothetical protein
VVVVGGFFRVSIRNVRKEREKSTVCMVIPLVSSGFTFRSRSLS